MVKYYGSSILELQSLNAVEGYKDGTYLPNAFINRAEFLKIVLEGSGVDFNQGDFADCFPDVNNKKIENQWFVPYVCYAKAQDYVKGYPTGLFEPAKEINYAEALKIVYEINGHSGQEHLPLPGGYEWYTKYLWDAQSKGIALKELNPENLLTRGEMAELMVRFNQQIDTQKICALSEVGELTKIPIVEADYETCEVVPGGHFVTDKDHVYRRLSYPGSMPIYIYEIAEGIDPETIEPIGPMDFRYFKDKNSLYWDEGQTVIPLAGVDLETIEPITTHFLKDKNHFYFYQQAASLEILEQVDLNSIEVLQSGHNHEQYFKDKNFVYFSNYHAESPLEVIEEADLESFQVMNDYLVAYDKNNIYREGEIVAEVSNPNNLEIVHYPIMKNGEHVYKNDQILEGINAEGFEFIGFSTHEYFKNIDHVYIHDFLRTVEGANPETFSLLARNYSKDDQLVFYDGFKIEGANVQTFQVLDYNGLAINKNHAYYQGRAIEGDPEEYL